MDKEEGMKEGDRTIEVEVGRGFCVKNTALFIREL